MVVGGGGTTEGDLKLSKELQLAELREEEAMMRQALEISLQEQQMKRHELDEEEEMIKRVMQMSEMEEKARLERIAKE
jgi:hypothetical protein